MKILPQTHERWSRLHEYGDNRKIIKALKKKKVVVSNAYISQLISGKKESARLVVISTIQAFYAAREKESKKVKQ